MRRTEAAIFALLFMVVFGAVMDIISIVDSKDTQARLDVLLERLEAMKGQGGNG